MLHWVNMNCVCTSMMKVQSEPTAFSQKEPGTHTGVRTAGHERGNGQFSQSAG